MSSGFQRKDRVAELLQRELALLIPHEIKNPKTPQFITITQVNVSPDLKNAKVFFTVLDADVKLTDLILNDSVPYIRSLLAKRVKLRIIPNLKFCYDESIEYSNKLAKLIDSLDKDSKK